MSLNIFALFLIPIYIAIPAIVIYYIIKLAVKNAIKELKDEQIL